jgi:hypothetical protein
MRQHNHLPTHCADGERGQMTILNRAYYRIKPFIPRRLQIAARRWVAARKRQSSRDVWPVDLNAGEPPQGWCGWPEGKKFALVLTHDVETGNGHDKCRLVMDLEQRMGFRSCFNFVAKRYKASQTVREILAENEFEVGIHGLYHDGRLFESRKIFDERAALINQYLKEWGSVGFYSPSMHRNLAWMHELNIEYDQSTFDTDPFEPQPDGVGTIFPFAVYKNSDQLSYPQHPINSSNPSNSINPSNLIIPSNPSNPSNSSNAVNPGNPTNSRNFFIEHPYTLPQDFTLFIILKEKDIRIWKDKLDWIAGKGGMALLNTHPDYMNCENGRCGLEEYPMRFYEEFLHYMKDKYQGQYWHALPREVARFWKEEMVGKC